MDTAPRPLASADAALDYAAGAAATAAAVTLGVATAAATAVAPVARPLARLALRPPLVPASYAPQTWLRLLKDVGRSQREATGHAVGLLLDWLVPEVLAQVLDRVDLTQIVLDRVDLDAVVSAVDLDGAVARVDLDAAAGRLDIDLIIGRLDLTRIVVENVDLDAVAARLDIESILDRLDLTALVENRVDVDALVAGVDLQAIIDRIDIVHIAEDVIDAVDLPEIIRESTGSVASETVRGVRMRSIAGDEAIGRVVDRMLLRRKARRTMPRRPAVLESDEGLDAEEAAPVPAAASPNGHVAVGPEVADVIADEIPEPREPGAVTLPP